MRELKNLYEAAGSGRRTQHWRRSNADANSEVGEGAEKLRAVARDMVRNNAFAERAKSAIRNNVVGPGIQIGLKGGPNKKREAIKRHLETTAVDADGVNTLYGLQALVMATVAEAGECLVRYRPRLSSDGFPLPFQLQVLEPDFLDGTKNGPLPNGNFAIQGKEFDLRGRCVAYWLFTVHPGAMVGPFYGSVASVRVSAENIAHVYRVDRPGQARGVTWFAPVILRLRDFADYTDAQLVRQKIAACFAAFITTSEGYDQPPAESGDAYPIEAIEPGMIERLREGESVQFGTPPVVADFEPFTRVTLREVAVGMGLPYEIFGDLSNVNYSSGRLGWLEFQRGIEVWRWNMMIPQLCHAVERWTSQAADVTFGGETVEFTWTPPRREMIDPSVEIEASIKAVRGGLSSRSEEVRQRGWDPVVLDAEIAADNARADEDELIFDTDPRRVTNRGVAQKYADPNAPDGAPQ